MAGKVKDRTQDLPELASPLDACEILGVHKMTFKRWRDEGFFAIEPKHTSAGPVWTRADLERFREQHVAAQGTRPGSRHARVEAVAAP